MSDCSVDWRFCVFIDELAVVVIINVHIEGVTILVQAAQVCTTITDSQGVGEINKVSLARIKSRKMFRIVTDRNFVLSTGPVWHYPSIQWGSGSLLAAQSKVGFVRSRLGYWTHDPDGSLPLAQLERLIPWASPQRVNSIHTYAGCWHEEHWNSVLLN